MATFRKAAGGWRAEVCVNGVRASKTLPTKAEANAWAKEKEAEIRTSPAIDSSTRTMADLWDAWHEKYKGQRKEQAWEKRRLDFYKRTSKLAAVKLSEITGEHIAQFREARLKDVSAATVNRDWNLLSSVCTDAIREMKWMRTNPFSEASKPPNPPPRARIPTDAELERIWYFCKPHLERVARFALATGMRQGEIAGLTWAQIENNVAHLKMTKNGKPRDVPLSKAALDLLPQSDTNPVFGLTATQIESQWRLTTKRAGVVDLHFHDLRARAATDLSKKLDPFELCRMFGWSKMDQALTYYRKSPGEIAGKLD